MQRLITPSAQISVRGLLTIHSAPSALRRHIDWAIQNIVGADAQVNWQPQSLMVGTFKTKCHWRGRGGSGAEIASTLRSWHYLNFEVLEENENGGELFRFTPELGLHRAVTDVSGAVLLNEYVLNTVIQSAFDDDSIRQALERAMGTPWDLELEKFRSAGMAEPARLHAI
ncbi:MAG: DUF3145 family protein [Actinomycetales bacterium]|nr:DUF3145 family protein [Actinomycetales bacterium]